jgi:type II secretory pathway pseudopilin PulG
MKIRFKPSCQGFSIVEAVVAMSLFAVGILALSQSYFGIMRAQQSARSHELAIHCARDRVEEIVNSVSYTGIASANFPDEDFGNVAGGLPAYAGFSRSVAIVDSINVIGQSVLKEITVQVNWQIPGGTRNVSLNTVVARFKDIQL